jgi:hypothetical protein
MESFARITADASTVKGINKLLLLQGKVIVIASKAWQSHKIEYVCHCEQSVAIS